MLLRQIKKSEEKKVHRHPREESLKEKKTQYKHLVSKYANIG
jgi:hypothetical protein